MPAETQLAAAVQQLESARQAAKSRLRLYMAAIAAATSLLCLYLYLSESFAATAIVAVAGTAFAMILRSRMLGKIKAEFKQAILPVLLRGIDASLQYRPLAYVDADDFNAANLFSRPDSYTGKDFVTGRVGDTDVRFSLVHTQERYEETSTDADGKTQSQTKYRTIFRGLFLVADFNKHFAGRTLVQPPAGWLGKMFGNRVALEDPEFNKLFTVNSTDQVEARYILTPSLMERMKAVRSRIGPFRAAFSRGNLFLAVDMDLDQFEPSMRQSLANSDQVERIRANLGSITDIVDDLGLNVRIWTKPAASRESEQVPA